MTTKNNKIIAEFMGFIPITESDFLADNYKVKKKDILMVIECTKYHSDWNWLMEVVEKIESINEANDEFYSDYSFIVTNFIQNWTAGFISRENVEIVNVEGLTRKESVYNACLEFIKWYNEQNKV